MQYRLMNDFCAEWPFWSDGLCAHGDPALPPELSRRARRWAAQFQAGFSVEGGWPNEAHAIAHEHEGRQLHEAIRRACPELDLQLVYWEHDHR